MWPVSRSSACRPRAHQHDTISRAERKTVAISRASSLAPSTKGNTPSLNSSSSVMPSEADICLEMAEQTDGALRKELVRTAARWIELAQEAEAHRRPN